MSTHSISFAGAHPIDVDVLVTRSTTGNASSVTLIPSYGNLLL